MPENNRYNTKKQEQTTNCGVLYGIGVGPGDPDLLTLRAVKALGNVDVVLAASSSKNDYSIAHGIAAPHLPSQVETLRLAFPMTREQAELQKAWEQNAALTAQVLRSGRNAAFLTLGDPMIFSTFCYLLRDLLKLIPELEVRIEPGITSFQEAAASSRTMLCAAGENFLLISGVNSREKLAQDLKLADNAAILKAYKNLPVIINTVQEVWQAKHHEPQNEDSTAESQAQSKQANLKSPVFVSRLGFEDQRICHDIESLEGNTPHYLSLLLLGKKF